MKILILKLFVALLICSNAYATVPNRIILPVDGTDWYNVTGSSFHTSTGGIGGADDRYALDLNRSSDRDNGASVYTIADGFVERNIGNGGWGKSTTGQLLLKHFNPDGSSYYCGYLHMKNITSLKSTQGAYIKANTKIGEVSNVGSDKTMPNHLHFACYDWDGKKLISKSLTTYQTASRPNVSIYGDLYINTQIVNKSPFQIWKTLPFYMSLNIKNNGTTTAGGNYYLLMTKDANGVNFVGKLDDLSMCTSLNPGKTMSISFDKSSFSSPAGYYYLQLYHDDCSSSGSALKRVNGINPIMIQLK